jgi:thiol-disulfide isomerase/thioredoxin
MQIGPFTVPFLILRLVAALAVGYGLQLAVLRRYKPAGRFFWDLLFDVLLIGFLLWKLAPLLSDPALLWNDPLAALYRPGGPLGLLLGALGGGGYAVVKLFRRRPLPEGLPKLGALTLGAAAAVFLLLGAVGPAEVTGIPGNNAGTEGAGGEIRQLIRESSTSLAGHDTAVRWEADYLIINFWASWCPPCRGEMPELIEFYKNIENKNVELIGLNMTSTEKSMGAVRDFVEGSALPFPVRLDRDGEIGRRLAIESLPTTIVIGPEGVRARRSGIIDRSWLRAQIPE